MFARGDLTNKPPNPAFGGASTYTIGSGVVSGDEDYDFKLASSYASIEAFGDNFQWNRDKQAYMKRSELFDGLLDCNVARSYTGDTLVNTLPTN